jgi:two-component system, chemotaxis family, chemotaxis protein CheY
MSVNILIVDDSPIIRSVLKKAITMANLPVAELYQAGNGQEALDVIEAEWIDVMFLDINMPVMNGVEVLQNLNENGDINSVKVIVISTEGSSTRIEELNKLGIKGFLRKPFTPEQFQEVFTKATDIQNAA